MLVRPTQLFACLALCACAPEPLTPFGISDDTQEPLPPSIERAEPKVKERMSPLAGSFVRIGTRIWAEGHSYRRFTIEVWGNKPARMSTAAGKTAPVGSEFIAAHYPDEKETVPITFFSMRKELLDGKPSWRFRAFDSNREALVFDPTRCASCHAMARYDSRFTFEQHRLDPPFSASSR